MHQINEVIQIKRYGEYENIDDFIIESRRFIGERITNLRMENGISEYKLSKSIGKNDGYIQKISSGKSLPSMEAFIDICAYFKRFYNKCWGVTSKGVIQPTLFFGK